MGIIAAVCARFALVAPYTYLSWCFDHPEIGRALENGGITLLVRFTAAVAWLAAAALVATAFTALRYRNTITLSIFRKVLLFTYAVAWMCGVAVTRATHIMLANDLSLDSATPVSTYSIFILRWQLLWPVILISLWIAYVYILAWRRVAINEWLGVSDTDPATGDRFLENLRTHGRDPRFRKSVWSSLSLHILVILVIPWLLTLDGCSRIDPYRVPKGSGTPTITIPKVVKVKKKKKKRILVNPNSAIIFNIPTLDDSKVAEEVDDESRVTYVADAGRVGAMGAGGGTKGGWPDGMDNSLVRFIYLKYDGAGWDDGMDDNSRAAINFLAYFRRITKFRTATQAESHSIAALAKYPKGFAPPFVFMTGEHGIRISDHDVKILRAYLMDGGMLFADCGSPTWHNAFRSFIGRVFPGEQLLTISDDDVIFQLPYTFPNGAPPLWHHGGYKALGIKYKGRWAVFYHPGDINDAWKDDRGGLDAKKAEGAMEMGVNIIYYSFSNYLELTRKYRK